MNNSAFILVVEDDLATSTFVRKKLEAADYKVVGVATNATQAIAMLKGNDVDVILMDINLEDGSDGVELAEVIQNDFDGSIIFVSAHTHEETIIRVKKVNPTAFLTKPFKEKDLLIAIELAVDATMKARNLPQKLLSDSLFLREKGGYQKIQLASIKWVKASGAYTEIYTSEGKKVIKGLLKSLLDKLPEGDFVRVHKSYIVNIKKITSLKSNKVFLEDEEIPISREVYADLIERITVI